MTSFSQACLLYALCFELYLIFLYQVAYREVASEEANIEETFERKLADRSHSLQLSLTLKPSPGGGTSEVEWSKVGEAVDSWTRLKPQTRRIIENGIKTGNQFAADRS